MVPVEVITSIQRRRCWSAEQKKVMVVEAEQPGMSVSIVARKYDVHTCQLFRWRRLFHEGALVAVGAEESLVPFSEVRGLRPPGPGVGGDSGLQDHGE